MFQIPGTCEMNLLHVWFGKMPKQYLCNTCHYYHAGQCKNFNKPIRPWRAFPQNTKKYVPVSKVGGGFIPVTRMGFNKPYVPWPVNKRPKFKQTGFTKKPPNIKHHSQTINGEVIGTGWGYSMPWEVSRLQYQRYLIEKEERILRYKREALQRYARKQMFRLRKYF